MRVRRVVFLLSGLAGLFLLVWLSTACGLLGLDGEVEVRVRNGSSLVLDQATLVLPFSRLVHTDLDPGEESEYARVDRAYRIASAEVVVGQDTARIQVIDYVGEQPLRDGRYTYVFRVMPGSPLSLGLEFERDS